MLLAFFQNKEGRRKRQYAYYIIETHSAVSEINREKGQMGDFQIKHRLYWLYATHSLEKRTYFEIKDAETVTAAVLLAMNLITVTYNVT
jgi:hypothetical protein